MITQVTVTEAARNFADLVNRAYYRSESTTLLKNGKPVACIVPPTTPLKTGREISARLAGPRPRLSAKEASAFETNLLEARKTIPAPFPKWD